MAWSLWTMSRSCLSWSACHFVDWLVLWGPCHCLAFRGVEWFLLLGPWDGLTCHGVEWFVLWGSWDGSLLVMVWNGLFFGSHVVGLLAIGVEWRAL